jgi:hypothetical protein
MNIYDIREAINEAKRVIRDGQKAARGMAPMLAGNLRHCYKGDLVKLKKELRDFNAHTREWKDLGGRQ